MGMRLKYGLLLFYMSYVAGLIIYGRWIAL